MCMNCCIWQTKAPSLRVVDNLLSHRDNELSPGLITRKPLLLLLCTTIVHMHIQAAASQRRSMVAYECGPWLWGAVEPKHPCSQGTGLLTPLSSKVPGARATGAGVLNPPKLLSSYWPRAEPTFYYSNKRLRKIPFTSAGLATQGHSLTLALRLDYMH